MTNEEAIDILENERPHCGRRITFTEEKKCEAFDMAIVALKAEPCEDAVSREAVLEKIDNLGVKGFTDYNSYSEMFDFVDTLPPVTPKPTGCENTISRKHLLSEIDELMQSPWFNNGKDDDMFTHYGYVERKEAVEVVRDLCVKEEPPVTPKQRTGKWIEERNDYGEIERWHCSECYEDTGFTTNCKWDFCPSCGAKMEGENNADSN